MQPQEYSSLVGVGLVEIPLGYFLVFLLSLSAISWEEGGNNSRHRRGCHKFVKCHKFCITFLANCPRASKNNAGQYGSGYIAAP